MSKPKKINSDTIHLWVHQTQDYSEIKGGRLFFRGDTIYSYGNHFPIARHVNFPNEIPGRHCILFTTRTYSVTTARHISEVRRAIPDYLTSFAVFNVDNVRAGENAEHYPEDAVRQHLHNLHDYHERIADTAGKAKRARCYRDLYIERLDNLIKEHNGYIDFFKLDARHIERHDGLIAQLVKDAEEARKREREREKERERQAETRNQEDIQKWLDGETSCFPFSVQRIYLRKGPGAVVTTSKGAIVPYAHARKAFQIAKRCHENLEELRANGCLPVGDYRIEHIDTFGNVKAGCHTIYWEQIEDFARREGWLDSGESSDSIPGEHDVVVGAIEEAALHQ
jgi:hypothetical protein